MCSDHKISEKIFLNYFSTYFSLCLNFALLVKFLYVPELKKNFYKIKRVQTVQHAVKSDLVSENFLKK